MFHRRSAVFAPVLLSAALAAQRPQGDGPFLGHEDLVRHGPSANRVDVVILGDGFTRSAQKSFDTKARGIPKLFERDRTIGEYFTYFNFIRANVASAEDGVDEQGRTFDTALGAFRKERADKKGYVWVDTDAVRKMLDHLPDHDGYALVVIKRGGIGSGGNGIATLGGASDLGIAHQWGHAFANLGDEHTVDLLGHRGEESNPVNLSGSKDSVPWQHWIDAKVRGVGVYEGGQGDSKGVWRSNTSNCAMGIGTIYCRVCREAVILQIYRHVDPIDGATPDPAAGDLELTGSLDFEVRLMQPKTHMIELRWWVLKEPEAPAANQAAGKDRSARGPLAAIPQKPIQESKGSRSGVHKFKLQARGLEPGRYRVLCRATDTTLLKGDAHPSVLKDTAGLLESERAWTVVVK